MKKTLAIFTFFLIFSSFAFSKDFTQSEISIYNEVTAAFDTGFYPGAVEKANLLESEYPDSVFVLPALVQKGEALIYLGRYEQACITLNSALGHMHTGSENFARCHFLLGKVNYLTKQYDLALPNFHAACTASIADKTTVFYTPSILYAARIYYLKEKFSESLSLFEYVIQNGLQYSKAEYEESLQKLLIAYNKTDNSQKAITLFANFTKEDLSQNVYFAASLTIGQSYELLKQYENAYNLYSTIAENAPEVYAVTALKKAYIIATDVFGYVEGNSFEKTISAINNNPELKTEFYLRLGIDEYNQKNYEKAKEYFETVSDNGLAILYQQKIALDLQEDLTLIEKNLLEKENAILTCGFENVSDTYYSLLLQCKAGLKKWNEAEVVFEKIENPDEQAVYNQASAYYSQKDFARTAAFLSEQFDKEQFEMNKVPLLWELYASSLVRSGSDADTVFSELSQTDLLSNAGKYEYAKVLFARGKYTFSLQLAEESEIPQASYLCGICCVNLKRWEDARNYFIDYIKNQSNKPAFNTLSLFYKGYSEYCLASYKDSYSTFVRFAVESSADNLKYVRSAYEFAAKSALQNGDLKNAAVQAENVIKNSVNEKDKQSAVLFCAEIYSDSKNYEQAIKLLTPYSENRNDFGIKTLFEIAKIYVKQGNIEAADKIYIRIYTDNPDSDYAEEAMYRSGEIYYSVNDYSGAESRLNKYVYKYVNGKFTEAALFYCGDSCLHLSQYEKSIMMNKTLVQKYPKSVYTYGTYTNLLNANYESENYLEAMDAAKFLVNNYQTQAASDGIGTKLLEIERIVNGSDPRIAQALSDYEKAGKTQTIEGRIAGSKLVKMYAASPDSKIEAYRLAVEILEKQTDEAERYYAAQNAEIIADYNRSNNENKDAAQMYLLAAEYYRGSAEGSSNAAAALYGATEAFVAAGYTEDAKQTADLLVRLYPESKQARNVRRLIK